MRASGAGAETMTRLTRGRHSFGSQGVISVTSNLLPGLFSRLMRTPNQELMDSLQDLIAWLFCEPNPIGINTAMVRVFLALQALLIPLQARMPLCNLLRHMQCQVYPDLSESCAHCDSCWW